LRWSADQFGERAANPVTLVYEAFYNIPYFANDRSNFVRRGDNYLSGSIKTLASDLQLAVQNPAQYLPQALKDAAQIENDITLNASIAYVSVLQNTAYSVAPSVEISRLDFYTSHVLSQIGIHMEALFCLQDVVHSIRAFASNQRDLSSQYLVSGISHLDKLFTHERFAAKGKWSTLYMNDKLTNFPLTRIAIRTALSIVSPDLIPVAPAVPYNLYYNWYDYQKSRENYYPYFYPSPLRMDFVVSALCNSSGCVNTPTGGNFTTPAIVFLATVKGGFAIRYTLDGTLPSANATLYTIPLTIRETTTIRAAAFGSNVPEFLPSTTNWYKNAPPKP